MSPKPAVISAVLSLRLDGGLECPISLKSTSKLASADMALSMTLWYIDNQGVKTAGPNQVIYVPVSPMCNIWSWLTRAKFPVVCRSWPRTSSLLSDLCFNASSLPSLHTAIITWCRLAQLLHLGSFLIVSELAQCEGTDSAYYVPGCRCCC